jgi:acyl-CoA synthetase (NDP forming)
LDILLAAPEFDLVVAAIGSSARSYPQATVRPLVECGGATKPLAVFLVPEAPEALAVLSRAGIPSFHTPEACADAVAAVLARRPPVDAVRRAGTHRSPSEVPGDTGTILDEEASGALLDRLGIARAASVALDADMASPPVLPFPYPVAVKILSADIPHKSDVGAVALGVPDAAALLDTTRKMRARVRARIPTARCDRVLVQPMISGVGEVLVGYRVDRDAGPLVMAAAGGVLAELARDRSLRLAPVDPSQAREMIEELRTLAALSGYRNRPKGDLDALVAAVVALSRLADEPSIAEAEINPLIVRPAGEGVVAVDALVRMV